MLELIIYKKNMVELIITASSISRAHTNIVWNWELYSGRVKSSEQMNADFGIYSLTKDWWEFDRKKKQERIDRAELCCNVHLLF